MHLAILEQAAAALEHEFAILERLALKGWVQWSNLLKCITLELRNLQFSRIKGCTSKSLCRTQIFNSFIPQLNTFHISTAYFFIVSLNIFLHSCPGLVFKWSFSPPKLCLHFPSEILAQSLVIIGSLTHRHILTAGARLPVRVKCDCMKVGIFYRLYKRRSGLIRSFVIDLRHLVERVYTRFLSVFWTDRIK